MPGTPDAEDPGGVIPFPGDSSPISLGGWRLQFDASSDDAIVQRYALEMYVPGTSVLLVSKDLGKPSPNASGVYAIDVDATVQLLAVAQFDVVVRAFGPSGSSASAPFRVQR